MKIFIWNKNKIILNKIFTSYYKKMAKILLKNEWIENHNYHYNIINDYIKIETNEFEKHDFNA